jgi:hypothetical protein
MRSAAHTFANGWTHMKPIVLIVAAIGAGFCIIEDTSISAAFEAPPISFRSASDTQPQIFLVEAKKRSAPREPQIKPPDEETEESAVDLTKAVGSAATPGARKQDDPCKGLSNQQRRTVALCRDNQ